MRDFDEALRLVERVCQIAVDYLRPPDICISEFNRVRLTIVNSNHAGLVPDLAAARTRVVDGVADRGVGVDEGAEDAADRRDRRDEPAEPEVVADADPVADALLEGRRVDQRRGAEQGDDEQRHVERGGAERDRGLAPDDGGR
jgi:hypothetical protein